MNLEGTHHTNTNTNTQMFYTLFVLVVGVYLGQEYTILPSVRALSFVLLDYLKEIKNKIEENDPNDDKEIKLTWQDIVRSLFTKDDSFKKK